MFQSGNKGNNFTKVPKKLCNKKNIVHKYLFINISLKINSIFSFNPINYEKSMLEIYSIHITSTNELITFKHAKFVL